MSREVEIEGALKAETEQAYLIDDGAVETWVPKSQVQYDGKTTFTMPEWLAFDKGLI